MPEPIEKKKMKKPVKYTLHDSDDEEDDTVETRKSVKTAEKMHGKRFFINAKEKRDYDQAITDGKISQKQLDFKEDEDEELGPANAEAKFKQDAKKKAKLEELAKKKAEKLAPKLSAKEKKEMEEEKEMADAIAKSKEERPDNQAPVPKKKAEAPKLEGAPLPPTPSDLPPELAGALAQQKHKSYESDSDSDSDDSSDSDDE